MSLILQNASKHQKTWYLLTRTISIELLGVPEFLRGEFPERRRVPDNLGVPAAADVLRGVGGQKQPL